MEKTTKKSESSSILRLLLPLAIILLGIVLTMALAVAGPVGVLFGLAVVIAGFAQLFRRLFKG